MRECNNFYIDGDWVAPIVQASNDEAARTVAAKLQAGMICLTGTDENITEPFGVTKSVIRRSPVDTVI